MIRILLVDDHQMMRDGLRALFQDRDDVQIVGEAEDGRSGVKQTRELEPDIVVMDVGMPDMNGIEATRRILEECPRSAVVALSTHSDKRYVLNMMEAGASGYVLKEAAGVDLMRAVEIVARGKKYLSPEITDVVVERAVGGNETAGSTAYSVLGAREREVLQLLAEGLTSKAIGAALHVSARTVETHRRNIMRKLGLHSVAELTKYAVREGLTTLD